MASIQNPIAPKSFMSATARHEWSRIIQLLQARELFDELRLAAIEAYAIAYGRFVQTEKELATAKEPETIDRLLAVSAAAARQMRYFGLALGLWGTPLARASTPDGDAPEPEPDRPLSQDELNAELNKELALLAAQHPPRKRRKLQ